MRRYTPNISANTSVSKNKNYSSCWEYIITLVPPLSQETERSDDESLISIPSSVLDIIKDNSQSDKIRLYHIKQISNSYGGNSKVGVVLTEIAADKNVSNVLRFYILKIIGTSFHKQAQSMALQVCFDLLIPLVVQCLMVCADAMPEIEAIRALLVTMHPKSGILEFRTFMKNLVQSTLKTALQARPNSSSWQFSPLRGGSPVNEGKALEIAFGVGPFFATNALRVCAIAAEEFIEEQKMPQNTIIEYDKLLELASFFSPLIIYATREKRSSVLFSGSSNSITSNNATSSDTDDEWEVLQLKQIRKAAGIQQLLLRLIFTQFQKACRSNDQIFRRRTASCLPYILQRWGCWKVPGKVNINTEDSPYQHIVVARSPAEEKVLLWASTMAFMVLKKTLQVKWVEGKHQLKNMLQSVIISDFKSLKEVEEIVGQEKFLKAYKLVEAGEKAYLAGVSKHRRNIQKSTVATYNEWITSMSSAGPDVKTDANFSMVQSCVEVASVNILKHRSCDSCRVRSLMRLLYKRPGLWFKMCTTIIDNNAGEDDDNRYGMYTIHPSTSKKMIRYRVMQNPECQLHTDQAYATNDIDNSNLTCLPLTRSIERATPTNDILNQKNDSNVTAMSSFMPVSDVLAGLQELQEYVRFIFLKF